jgi:hypothetical protein
LLAGQVRVEKVVWGLLQQYWWCICCKRLDVHSICMSKGPN